MTTDTSSGSEGGPVAFVESAADFVLRPQRNLLRNAIDGFGKHPLVVGTGEYWSGGDGGLVVTISAADKGCTTYEMFSYLVAY